MIKALKRFFVFLWRWWNGKLKNIELADTGSQARSEAEEAVARVIYETDLVPDCVAASVIMGGCAIIITRDGGVGETFVGKSYNHAADKAVEWVKTRAVAEGVNLKAQGSTSGLNRAQRRAFDRKRRRGR